MERIWQKLRIIYCFFIEKRVILLGFLCLLSAIISNSVLTYTSFAVDPTLTASLDKENLDFVFSGSDLINEVSLSKLSKLSVKTNARAGYTVTLSASSDETDLKNTNTALSTKVSSIASADTSLSANTWGYQTDTGTNYNAIPKLSEPKTIAQTNQKSESQATHLLRLAVKVGENLMPGTYKNSLVYSVIANPYELAAHLVNGLDFNTMVKSVSSGGTNIKQFARSATPPAAGVDSREVSNPDKSDCDIKIWYQADTFTLYYYTEADKIYFHEDSSRAFKNLSGLQVLNLNDFDASYTKNMTEMFSGLEKVYNIDTSGLNAKSVTNMAGIFGYNARTSHISFNGFNTENVTDMSRMFEGCTDLTSVDFSNINTKNVTTMRYMFRRATKLGAIILEKFDTSNVVDMYGMFSNMTALHQIVGLKNFNTEKVENMDGMFWNCTSLGSLDLSSFRTPKLKIMRSMFYGMSGLMSINLSTFDTSNVTNMSSLFEGVSSLTELDLSSFRTENVETMERMFALMPAIQVIHIDNFKTPKLTNVTELFSRFDPGVAMGLTGNDQLERIYCNEDFDVSNITSQGGARIFAGRRKVRDHVGPQNLTFKDKTWLRIGERSSRRGAFTKP